MVQGILFPHHLLRYIIQNPASAMMVTKRGIITHLQFYRFKNLEHNQNDQYNVAK